MKLITSALPYANGSIHIGHLVEYILTDVFVRFLKLIGDDVIYLCADDTHGSPIYIKAKALGITPEKLIQDYNIEHQKDFKKFHIHFDYYYSTHSNENEKHSTTIYEKLKENGHIITKSVEQYFCEHDQMFLSDRFIKGTCPNCKSQDQYGDSCEICGLHYNPLDLIDPYCSFCGNKPIRKESTHYFFKLSDFTNDLKKWTQQNGHLQSETLNSINEWLTNGLNDWDISRDAPYFGFKIPGEENKYFYVWLDAPVGYIATTEKYCKENGKDFHEYWFNPDTKIYHFIGKDITYFHTLFWPAMLMGSGYNVPSGVYVHGFLTVNGTKMSKSRGTFITAASYLEFLDPQYLRYYFISKLAANSDDIDLNFDDFRLKVNAELINNIINIGSRAISMINKNFESKVGSMSSVGESNFNSISVRVNEISQHYQQREFSKAIKVIIEISDIANKFFSENEPWKLLKTNPQLAHEVCSFSLNVFKLICTVLKPVLPQLASDVEEILNIKYQYWQDATIALDSNHKINAFKHLLGRINQKMVDSLLESNNNTNVA